MLAGHFCLHTKRGFGCLLIHEGKQLATGFQRNFLDLMLELRLSYAHENQTCPSRPTFISQL